MAGVSPSYHHGNVREAAVDAGLELLEQEGESKLSLRSIAERVGVTHRALYRHFPDREALMAELARRSLQALYDRLEEAASLSQGLGASFDHVVGTYVDFAFEKPAVYRQSFTAGFARSDAHPELVEVSKALGKLLSEVLDAPHSPSRIPDEGIALWGLLHGLVDLYWGGSLRASSPASAKAYILEQARRFMSPVQE